MAQRDIARLSGLSLASATGLPPGLVVDPASGTISGTPTRAGEFAVVVTATNEVGSTSTTFTISIAAAFVRFPAFSVGSGAGIPAEIRLYNSDGSLAQTLRPFGDFSGGVTVATGDLDGDGVNDTVAGAGAGGGPRVVVLSGATGAVLADFFAYEASFRGGVWVAIGDVDGDGANEIVVGAGVGGGPRVRVVQLDGSVVADFFTAESDLRFGVTIAVADLDGDGIADVVTGTRRTVSIFAGGEFSLLSQFDSGLPGPIGVAVAGGSIFASPGFGDSAQVRTFSSNGEAAGSQPLFEEAFTGRARIAATDLDGDGGFELIVGAGVGGSPRVRILPPKRPFPPGLVGLAGRESRCDLLQYSIPRPRSDNSKLKWRRCRSVRRFATRGLTAAANNAPGPAPIVYDVAIRFYDLRHTVPATCPCERGRDPPFVRSRSARRRRRQARIWPRQPVLAQWRHLGDRLAQMDE